MIQNKCKIIGITGGIATGKSTVSNILLENGYYVIDADKIAKEVVEINKPAYLNIVEEFGENILLKDKTIDRKALGSIIFKDEKAREKLNKITHPYIFQSIKSKIDEGCKDKEEKYIFLDIPLLFEQFNMWEKFDIKFDEILLVYIDEETQIRRLIKRNNISREEALNMMKSQMSIEEKKQRSSKTIDNSGSIESLNKQIDKLIKKLI